MGLIKRLFGLIGAIFGFIGGIFGAIFGIFRRRPQTESSLEVSFFLDPDDAKSVGRQNEPARPEAKLNTAAARVAMAFNSGSPDLSNRRRPGPNMNAFLDMAKQVRRT
ncbi:hypothetical protein GlitD10_2621 [Gloeomargarita lithophora Alchichica-D10]|uniref:Uncharacterized protein n=1 Tax=Gloeomargarita lithophora Alchichica-D10 TaxID=1188229 RepID=A0A1J0AG83_9CYAN|nr:hypothetical protein [Gloeomargarita lithophora]APB34962.1 hypothetical protein GlitD10_2621 [Gloeomargarita lithophora Alchichica-D10]